MIINTKLIHFFCSHILNQMPADQEFSFSHDYYRVIACMSICDDKYNKESMAGSLFDDVSTMKQMLTDPYCWTEKSISHFGVIFLEIGKNQIEGPGNFADEFIFTKKIIQRLLRRLMKILSWPKNKEFKLTKTSGWFIPYNKMFYLDEDSSDGNVMQQIDFKPAFEKIISIYEGKTPLEEFDVEMFYWLLKVCVYNSYHD
ncbi:hypothetical protein FJ366_03705 [Candidatus Dependentiae bacterium]|nr:hypothetical protein [Candidatus Dependentiae bacterium]